MIDTKARFLFTAYIQRFFFLLIITIHAFECFSQTKHIDSLRTNILMAKNDHQKLEAAFVLCDEANSLHPDTLYKYYTLANMIASREKLSDDIIQSGLYKGIYLSRK